MRAALAAAIVCGLAGCSMALQTQPPDPVPAAPARIECSRSSYAAADFSIAILAGLVFGGLSAIASNIGAESTGPKPGQAIIIGTVAGSPWWLSGILGIRWASKCRRLQDARKPATSGSGT